MHMRRLYSIGLRFCLVVLLFSLLLCNRDEVKTYEEKKEFITDSTEINSVKIKTH